MELRHLRYFATIASEMHVTRAAEKLGVAQPALTQQMRALESELGVELWKRAGRRIELTEAGKALHQASTAILGQVTDAISTTRKAARGETGRVVIGYIETATYTSVMARFLSSCRQNWPLLELELVQDRTVALIDALRRRRVDIAFVRPPIEDCEGIVLQTMAKEALVVAVPSRHKLARRRSVPIALLRDETFIGHARQEGRTGLHDAIDNACRQAGFERRIGQFTPQFSSSLNLVAASMGIAIVPACMSGFRSTEISYLSIADRPRVNSEIALAYRQEEAAPAPRNLLDLARNQP